MEVVQVHLALSQSTVVMLYGTLVRCVPEDARGDWLSGVNLMTPVCQLDDDLHLLPCAVVVPHIGLVPYIPHHYALIAAECADYSFYEFLVHVERLLLATVVVFVEPVVNVAYHWRYRQSTFAGIGNHLPQIRYRLIGVVALYPKPYAVESQCFGALHYLQVSLAGVGRLGLVESLYHSYTLVPLPRLLLGHLFAIGRGAHDERQGKDDEQHSLHDRFLIFYR